MIKRLKKLWGWGIQYEKKIIEVYNYQEIMALKMKKMGEVLHFKIIKIYLDKYKKICYY